MWQTHGIVYLCVFSDNKKYIGSTSRGIGEGFNYWGGNEEIEKRVGVDDKPKLAILAYACDNEELVIKETLFQIANHVDESNDFLNEKIERKELAEKKLKINLENSQLTSLKLDDNWIFENLYNDKFEANVSGDCQTKLEVDGYSTFRNPILYCGETPDYDQMAKTLF